MKQKTYYHIILDQSGSMQDCLTPTISGFNEQMQMIANLQRRFPEQEVRVGLTRFNEEVMHTYFAKSPGAVVELNTALYKPNGSTALYDAIGLTTKKLQKDIKAELLERTATVIIVILTDGYENASQYYSLHQVKNMIKELEATEQWTFSYLGATLDAEEIAAELNIQKQNSMSFDKDCVHETFCELSTSMDSYLKKRRAGKNPTDFLKPNA